MPSTISEPPPAYAFTHAPPLHLSNTAYHQVPKDDIMYDPVTGERTGRLRYHDRKRANRHKLWCLLVLILVLVMIALVIGGAVYHFGRVDNSNNSVFDDCEPTEFNGYSCN